MSATGAGREEKAVEKQNPGDRKCSLLKRVDFV